MIAWASSLTECSEISLPFGLYRYDTTRRFEFVLTTIFFRNSKCTLKPSFKEYFTWCVLRETDNCSTFLRSISRNKPAVEGLSRWHRDTDVLVAVKLEVSWLARAYLCFWFSLSEKTVAGGIDKFVLVFPESADCQCWDAGQTGKDCLRYHEKVSGHLSFGFLLNYS